MNKNRNKISLKFIFRKVIPVILTITLITSSAALTKATDVYAAGAPGATEVALDLYETDGYDQDSGEEAGEDQDEVSEESVFTPKARYFAEALAQKCERLPGKFVLSPESRFYIVTEDEAIPPEDITETVSLIDSELASYVLPSGQALSVVYGEEDYAEEGDIMICLTDSDHMADYADSADINESYILSIGDLVKITACDADGVYYGLLTLLEIAMSERGDKTGEEQIVMPGMMITDGPDLAERTVLLDCGRKYFSVEWMKNFIRRASMQRYNAIVLHFSEAEGLRLDSRVFPWLTKKIDSYSMDEMAEIVRLANEYHVDVIPSFDTPGHNRFIVERYAQYVSKHPDFEFTCDDKTYDSSIKGFGSIANHYSYDGETKKADHIGIDITKKHAVAFINALVDDYAKFFRSLGCDRFDIGGDEIFGWYTVTVGDKTFDYDNRWGAVQHWAEYARKKLGIRKGSASDTYIDYLNKLAERLERKGYTCRVFNDEIDLNSNQHIELNKSIDITFWINQGQGAKHYAKKGHRMYNFTETWSFYVLRKRKGRDIMKTTYKTVNSRNIYENWDPRSFAGTSGKWRPVGKKLGGAYFAIWCDQPEYKSESVVWKETEMRMWANASRMWNIEVGSDGSGIGSGISYKSFRKFVKWTNGFPGYAGDPSEAAVMAEPAAAESAARWWKKLLGSMDLYN